MKPALVIAWGCVCLIWVLMAIWSGDARYAWTGAVLFIGAIGIYRLAYPKSPKIGKVGFDPKTGENIQYDGFGREVGRF